MATEDLKIRFTAVDNVSQPVEKIGKKSQDTKKHVSDLQKQLEKGLGAGGGITKSAGMGESEGIGGASGLMGSLGALKGLGPVALAVTAAVIAFTAIEKIAKAVFDIFKKLVETLVELGTKALEAATEMETWRLTFEAIGMTAVDAESKVQWIEDFAPFSMLHKKDMVDMATTIELMGLSSQHWLPVISMVGGAFGGSAEKAGLFASLMERIAMKGLDGRTIKALAKLGISKKDFQAQGIEFKGQTPGGSIDEQLTALEAIARKKFKGAATAFKDSMALAIINIEDAWDKFLESVGFSIMPYIKPIIADVLEILRGLIGTGAGIGELIGTTVANLYKIIGGKEGVMRMVSWIMTVIDRLPAIFAVLEGIALGLFMTLKLFGTVLLATVKWAFIMPLQTMLNYLIVGLVIAAKIIDAIAGTDYSKKIKFFTFGSDMPGTMGGAFAPLGKSADDNYKKLEKSMAAGKFITPPATDPSKYGQFWEEPIDEIASNTNETTQQLKAIREDTKRYILGGGDKGRVGITPVEYNNYRKGKYNITVKTGNGSTSIEGLLKEIFHQMLESTQQAGGV